MLHPKCSVSLNSNPQAFPNNLRSCRLWELPETVREENYGHSDIEVPRLAVGLTPRLSESLFVHRVWGPSFHSQHLSKKEKELCFTH